MIVVGYVEGMRAEKSRDMLRNAGTRADYKDRERKYNLVVPEYCVAQFALGPRDQTVARLASCGTVCPPLSIQSLDDGETTSISRSDRESSAWTPHREGKSRSASHRV